MINNSLSPSEIHDIAQNLKKIKPGTLPLEIFSEFCRLKVTITLEVVPLCLSPDGQVYVVMFNRGPDDLWWPNEFHTPGTCLHPNDIPEGQWGLPTKAFDRLKDTELKEIKLIGDLNFIDNHNRQTNRGPESVQVYLQEVDYESAKQNIFPVNQLPSNTMAHQIPMIQKCVEVFKSQKSL